MPSLISNALRLLGAQESSPAFVQAVRECRRPLSNYSKTELSAFSIHLRERMSVSTRWDESKLIPAFAIASEALYRALGFELYDVQLCAARTLAAGEIAEMQTGEGKTFAAVPAAIWGGLIGRGVHISTPNTYLARRDYEQLKPVYEMAGVSVGLLPERTSIAEKRDAYSCDVTYGSGYEFGFDYLRDQLVLRSRARQQLGQGLLQALAPNDANDRNSDTCQRGLAFAIVDEADNVMIDDATSPLVLSESQSGEAPDSVAVRLARHVAIHLSDEHIQEIGSQRIELSDAGRERIHQSDIPIPVNQLLRPWASYVETALRAERFFFRDVHYVVDQDEIQIVDATTGRVFVDRSWQSGLHQAVEAKEDLTITPEKSALAQITRQRFYRLYERVSGMTGTAASCRRELRAVYGIQTRIIPLRTPSLRTRLPMRCFVSQEEKWNAIVESILVHHANRRPVLIGTRTIAESARLEDQLAKHDVPFAVLNDRQDAEEADIVALAGQAGKITIATNLAGRGTDIKLSNHAKALGGLHVIVSECHESPRIDRQMIGRSGRQGDPGSQVFVAMDDWLIRTSGPWLANSAKRLADENGEISTSLEQQVLRIQAAAERQQYAIRAEMLRRDLAKDSLLAD